ncbi:MAG: MBL fold metallo-hydrolase [Pirellulales bacterium]
MKLLLLGTTGYHPNDRRHTACLMIPELGVVFDAGTAMYRVSDYLTTDTLDIFLTHAHLDHVIGLTYLFDVLERHPLLQVTVHAEQEKLDALRTHLFSELLFPVMPPFHMQPLKQKTLLATQSRATGQQANPPEANRGVLTHFPLRHPGGSIGYRVDWPDRSLAYVTDTVAAPEVDYIEKIQGVDLLIHECFFGDESPERAELTGHSCLTPVAQVAAAAGVGRMVLVHINPLLNDDRQIRLGEAQNIFPHIQIGTDRMELEI